MTSASGQSSRTGLCRLPVTRGLACQTYGVLRSAVDCDEKMELAFAGSHRRDVNVEVSDRISIEARLLGGLAGQRGESSDAVALGQRRRARFTPPCCSTDRLRRAGAPM